jgi:hypothetical protein
MKCWTYEEIVKVYSQKVARYVVRRYHTYGVELDDVQQEIELWLFLNEEKVRRWLDNEPQQTTRIYRSMLDAATKYAEREKAQKVGYSVVDVYWYTHNNITNLMPHVLNPDFTEENGRIGELITMVLDVRRVLTPDLIEWFHHHDSEDRLWRSQVGEVIARLNDQKPARRRVLSNAHAQHITGEDA